MTGTPEALPKVNRTSIHGTHEHSKSNKTHTGHDIKIKIWTQETKPPLRFAEKGTQTCCVQVACAFQVAQQRRRERLAARRAALRLASPIGIAALA